MDFSLIDQLIIDGEYNKALSELLKFDDSDIKLIYKCNILRELGELQEAKELIEPLILKFEKNDDSDLLVQSYFSLSSILINQDSDTARKYIMKGINKLKKVNFDTDSHLYSLNGKFLEIYGSYFVKIGDYNKAITYHMRALNIFTELNDQAKIATALNNIGIAQYSNGKMKIALDYYVQSLEIKKTLNNKAEIARSLNNIGIIYRNLGDLNLALENYLESIEIKKIYDNKQSIALVYHNIGIIYKDKGEYDIALNYYQQSLDIWETLENKPRISIIKYGDTLWRKK